MGALMDKTFGDPTDPIEPFYGGDRRALAAQRAERILSVDEAMNRFDPH
jgi:hypothetical protein